MEKKEQKHCKISEENELIGLKKELLISVPCCIIFAPSKD